MEEDISALQARLHPRAYRCEVGKNILAQMASSGSSYYGLLTLPAAARVLDVYGWVPEPIASSGTPRGGFVALTSLSVCVGTPSDADYYLVPKEAYGATPSWSVAADKGVGLSSDARVSAVASFTTDTEIRLQVTPNTGGDLMTITGGKIIIVITIIDPAEV